jgi:hypothetical protein
MLPQVIWLCPVKHISYFHDENSVRKWFECTQWIIFRICSCHSINLAAHHLSANHLSSQSYAITTQPACMLFQWFSLHSATSLWWVLPRIILISELLVFTILPIPTFRLSCNRHWSDLGKTFDHGGRISTAWGFNYYTTGNLLVQHRGAVVQHWSSTRTARGAQ